MKPIGFRCHKAQSREKNTRPFKHVFLNELQELEKKQLGPLDDIDTGNQFLSNFDWTNSF